MNQRNCPFCRRILPSYEGCNCIWNEDENDEELVSERNNNDKINQSCQENDRQEPQQSSSQPVETVAEFLRAKFSGCKAGDCLFCDNPKKFAELFRTSGRYIQLSSDCRDTSSDQSVDENYVLNSSNATAKSFVDSFEHSRKHMYQCSYCSKAFRDNHKQQRHILVHTGELPFECRSCGLRFNQKVNLERHYALYSKKKAFNCDGCGIEFPLQCALEAHLRLEKKNKHFVCDFCWKKFFSNRLLKLHKQSHSRERLYKCRVCGKDYVHRQSLQRHKIQHR